MKRSFTLPAIAVLVFIGLGSCNLQEETGKLKLDIRQNSSETLKAALTEGRISAALVTVTGENGRLICDKERLDPYHFGEGFISESLELPVGKFQLDEFMLIDSAGVVRWATPLRGSGLAGLVSQPLPRAFGIDPAGTTTLQLEVVRTLDYQPMDFGYASFEIAFIEHFCVQVFYNTRCLEEWNDSILGPDGSAAPVYVSMLSVRTTDRRLLYEPLNPGLNHYQLPLLREVYYLEATDCRGQVVYRARMGLDQLLTYPCRDDAPALVIDRDSVPGITITPEGLREPAISQGVFGQITLGLDSYMLIDSTDIPPAVRDIYFFPYAVMDSIYSFAPIDCHFPIHLIGTEPVAVVRSNTAGYYQVRLAEGNYLYLVRDGDLYYLDAWVSSHRPGHVEVYRDSVTERHIHVLDCSMWM